MKMTVSIAMLRKAGACIDGQESFRKIFGDKGQVNWTAEKQIELFKTDLGRQFQWTYVNKFLPLYNMRYANFDNTTFVYNTMFSNLSLQGASFINCRCDRIYFNNADANTANFENSVFAAATFSSASLRSSSFARVTINTGSFYGADLTGASFAGAKLSNVDFRQAMTTNTIFVGAKLVNCTHSNQPEIVAAIAAYERTVAEAAAKPKKRKTTKPKKAA